MDPAFFYTYVNTLVHNHYSKYNAIISFMNDPTIIPEYKRIPEVQIETEHAIQLLDGVINNQVNNQQIHTQNNLQHLHDEDEYFNNPPHPPRLRRS